MKFKVERICRTDSLSVIPMTRERFDLTASEDSLRRAGYTVEAFELYLGFEMDGLEVTLYPSGRILLHPLNDKARAKELAAIIFPLLIGEE